MLVFVLIPGYFWRNLFVKYLHRYSPFPLFFYFYLAVLQVSLVPKGYSRNFTFTEEDDTKEVARITLPSFLFHKQGNYVKYIRII